ncbi:MAG: hypothetical protein HY343_03705 [Lentisphaerae bacterium]|nr:hypothetical protein [Lentisphaerota bacterium]
MSPFRSSAPPPLPATGLRPGLWGPSTGLPILILALFVFLPIWFWFFCRIEPGTDRIAVLIRKTGKDIPSGQILALEPGQKGIQLDVLSEGRYFKNPYTWSWLIANITDIPAGKVGVKTRLYGKELPAGKIIADDAASKGIVHEVLSPGKYRINPYAYRVDQHDAITIRPGSLGVVTSLIGADPLNNEMSPEKRNTFLVEKDMKGVLPTVLDPGTYYLNPYMVNVVEVDIQSQRFEMAGDDAITFLTLDGFTVMVEGTLEFAISRDKVALLTHQVGDMEDIIKKIILPNARGFSRLEGSKKPALNYIVGETRQEFQNSLEAHLESQCKKWGVDIRSVLIRNITPPDDIASIIRDREVAVQTAKMYEQQLEQAKSKAELTKQEMLAVQNKEKVDAETLKIKAVIEAKQNQEVVIISANKELEVARLENDAATFTTNAILLKADAERDVINLKNKAESDVFAGQSKAFSGGMNYARYVFYQRLGPRIRSVLSGDQPDSLGAIFTPFVPSRKEVK